MEKYTREQLDRRFAERQQELGQELDRAIGQAMEALAEARQLVRTNFMYCQLQNKTDQAAGQAARNVIPQAGQEPGPPWLYGQEPDLQ